MTATWTQGPVEIRGGAVDLSTVPSGFVITFDDVAGEVGFTAPGPVVAVVTAASDPITHLIEPPATAGSVPLSTNPGDGDVVLCGVMEPVEPVELTCDGLDDVVPLGPVTIADGTVVDPLPSGIMSIAPNAVDIAFVADEPVAAVVVAASEPQLFPFAPTVLAGAVDVALNGDDAEVLFCVTQAADDPDGSDDDTVTTQTDDTEATDDAADDAADGTADAASAGDPTTIPTGGGPSGRTALVLVAFVIIALSGSTGLLLWSRGG